MENKIQIHSRDIIAILVLTACFILIGLGVDTFITAITAVIIGYYFSKRVYEERNPNGDLNEKVKELEAKVNEPKVMMAKFGEVKKAILTNSEPLTTGDFKPVINKEKDI